MGFSNKNGSQPPQNSKTIIKALTSILEYSPKKNKAKIKPEYSIL